MQNNPLGRVDPDGLDDYMVFVPDTRARGNWRRAEAAAKANGHTFQLFKDDRANVDAWITARKNSNARVVYVGHTSHDEKGVNAVVLSDGRSTGNVAWTGENTPEFTMFSFEPAEQSVGLFACDSIDLARQYPGSDFVGVDSGPGGETSLEAMGPAAVAFVTADAAARPANGQPPANPSDPIAAANSALKANKRKEDLDQDRVKRP